MQQNISSHWHVPVADGLTLKGVRPGTRAQTLEGPGWSPSLSLNAHWLLTVLGGDGPVQNGRKITEFFGPAKKHKGPKTRARDASGLARGPPPSLIWESTRASRAFLATTSLRLSLLRGDFLSGPRGRLLRLMEDRLEAGATPTFHGPAPAHPCSSRSWAATSPGGQGLPSEGCS